MDPVTIFGVAASVVQFIDFTENLLRGTYEIYKSATTTGDTKVNFDLMTVTTSLQTLNDDLQSSLRRGKSNGEKPSKFEVEIDNISKDCSEVAQALIAKLEKLRVQKYQDLWESFRKALQTVWSKKEIESLEKRLEKFRTHISLQINSSLREQVEALQTTQSSHGRLISSSLQVTQEVRQSLLKQMGQNAMWQQKVIDVVSSNMRPGPHGPLTIWDRSALMSSPESWFYKEFAGQFTKLLLRSLRFDDMNRRSRAVSNPYPKTFEWIYSDYSKDTTASFLHFLEYDQNLFWITGKPASGKSTLMKLISEDARTISHLDLWTAGEELLVSRFYFWCSGTEMQMSQEGLIRTLLCEAIQQLPGLAPIVFHDLMESFVIFGNGAVFNTHWDNSLWDMAELLEAFKRLVLEVTKSKKMFLLIDGLDEYHGDHSEQLKLVEFVYSLLSLSSNIKICVSSRPWNIFADAFHTSPSLRVEDLTFSDIQYYISSNLSNNLGFVALQRGDPKYASSLIDNVSTKASGVFLWVVLVVQSLLEGLTDGERLSDLQRRLDSLPADLETLFWKILKSANFERVSQLIQILEKSMQQQTLQQQSLRAHSVEQKARKPSCQALTAIQLSFADEDDPEFISQLEVPTVDTQKAIRFSRAEQMRRRLNACSKGLLEVKTKSTGEGQNLADAKVEYLHRTVRDFVRRPDIWKKLREATTPPFDPEERLAVSVVACFKMSFEQQSGYFYRMSYGLQEGVFHRYPRFWDMLIHTMIYIYRYGPSSVDSQVRLLDELEKTIRFLMAGDILGRGVEYKDCPLNTEPDVLLISSFLHLAVKLQLNAYVKSIAQSLHREGQIDNFSNLFQMAATEYRTAQSTFKLDDPSLRLIETFLELGVNPNQPLRANPTMTVWQFVVSDSAKRPEILKLFIRHGADPFVPELDDLSEGGDDFGELLRTKRKEATKNGTRWDDAASASKTTSKWSRLRSPKLFGRTRGRGHHSDSLTNL